MNDTSDKVVAVLQKLFLERVKHNDNSGFSSLDENCEPIYFKWFSTRIIAYELNMLPVNVRKKLIKLEESKIIEKNKMFGCSVFCIKNIDNFKQSTLTDFYSRSVNVSWLCDVAEKTHLKL